MAQRHLDPPPHLHRKRSCNSLAAEDSPDRDVLDRCLSLSATLAQFVASQQQLQAALPRRLSGLLAKQHAAAEQLQQQGDADGEAACCCVTDALQVGGCRLGGVLAVGAPGCCSAHTIAPCAAVPLLPQVVAAQGAWADAAARAQEVLAAVAAAAESDDDDD
jgi:hypothetical protein